MLEDAAKDAPNSDMMNNSLRSINNNNITSSINSTTSYVPSSYTSDNSNKGITNNTHIGSVASYIPISAMGSKNNNITNLVTEKTMSHVPTFNMGHISVQNNSNNNNHIGFDTPSLGHQSAGLNLARIPSSKFSLSSTQENQNGSKDYYGIGYYTNLMTSFENSNVNLENTNFMGYGPHYRRGEGSNFFSGSASECFVKENILESSMITPDMMQGLSIQDEHYVPFGTPNLVANLDQCGSNSSNIVDQYASFFFNGGGSSMPQEHNFLFDNDQLSIPENNGVIQTLNSLHYPLTNTGVGSSFMNEDVHSSYNQGNYYSYDVYESGHMDYGNGREVLNSEAFGGTTGAIGYGEQHWNGSMG